MILILWALVITIAFQFFYFVFVFGQLARYKIYKKPSDENHQPCTVLICCKNELKNLQDNLHLFLSQDFPLFEVLVVNDNSYDGTKEYLEEQLILFKNLRVVNVEPNENFWSNKKYALTLGIKAAKYENLIFSDADCKPASNQWLKKMTDYDYQKEIILGYSPYYKEKGMLNLMIRFETVFSAIQYFSWSLFSKAYMGVGRNLAYKKTLFFKHNGFVNHIKVRSGDDDLFVNEATTKVNTQIQIDPESFVYSIPKKTWKEWIYQKRRHITTSKYYHWTDQLKLSLFYFTQVAFFALMIINLFFQQNLETVLSLISFRYLFVLIIFAINAKKLKDSNLIWFYIFAEPFLILIQFYIFVRNLISKPILWK